MRETECDSEKLRGKGPGKSNNTKNVSVKRHRSQRAQCSGPLGTGQVISEISALERIAVFQCGAIMDTTAVLKSNCA